MFLQVMAGIAQDIATTTGLDKNKYFFVYEIKLETFYKNVFDLFHNILTIAS